VLHTGLPVRLSENSAGRVMEQAIESQEAILLEVVCGKVVTGDLARLRSRSLTPRG
jgi:hypothetical protein